MKIRTVMASNDFHPHEKMLEFLVCPVTKAQLEYDSHQNELISKAAKLAFPIKNGIPLMLIDEARKLDDEHK